MSKLFGTISRFDTTRGYGFVSTAHVGGEMNLFFHISNCVGFLPSPGHHVMFNVGAGRPGKGPQAVNVALASSEEIATHTGVSALAGTQEGGQ